MKLHTTMALIGALGLWAGSAALAQPAPDNDGLQANHGPRHAPPRWVDPEIRRKALLDQYDADKDGKLDNAEYAAIGRDVESGKFAERMGVRRGAGFGQRGPAAGPGGFGPRGPRALGGPGFGPRHEEILQKYDANKDGRIDESEREVIRKDIADGKLPRLGLGQGRRGFGPPPGNETAAPPADAPAED